jgi:8-oxo-dGTP pyrophosphatase MutT (NUDIX family)
MRVRRINVRRPKEVRLVAGTGSAASGSPSFAAAVVTDAEGRVLLVHTTYGERKWNLPGGVLEQGEAPWEAARREAREELGIELGGMSLCGVYFLAHRDAFGFIFRASGFAGDIRPDGKEIDEAGYFDAAALPSPISSFARERILDALAGSLVPALKVQHRRDRTVG